MITISTGRNYDEILEELRRQTSRPSRMRELESVAVLAELASGAIAKAAREMGPRLSGCSTVRATRGKLLG